MPNQKISELSAIETIDNALDVLPIVDTSTNTTKKVTPTQIKAALSLNNVDNTSDLNKPISTATQTALDGKQASLGFTAENAANKSTSVVTDQASNVKYPTVKALYDWAVATFQAALGYTPANRAGDTFTGAISATNLSGTNTGDNATNSQYSGLATSKQDTLVSGTNIKTINSTSLLGSGDIVISASPSGVSGAIQFSNGSAFASDAANLFWDDTNNRLGIGTNAPTQVLDIVTTTQIPLKLSNNQTFVRTLYSNNSASGTFDFINNYFSFGGNNLVVGSSSNLNARLGVVGSGSTSATTSLLVQNSAGSELAKFNDDGSISFGSKLNVSTIGTINASGNVYALGGSSVQVTAAGNFRFVVGSVISNSSDGVLMLSDFAMSTFNRLQFGGTSASFPSLKRALNNFEVKNADDTFGAGISVGGTLVASAILQADSTTKGFLPPRMTTTQKNAIATPASGLVVYDTTTNKLCCYNGSTWNDLF